MKRTKVTIVPCSASKRSIKGVRAMVLKIRWKMEAWRRGKVFRR